LSTLVRAFIAIDLPETLRDALDRSQKQFRASAPDARWSRPAGIHLTLKFLGQIQDAQVEEVEERLKALGRFVPFRVEIRGFGFFPDARRPRVFWAGVESPQGLAELAARVEAAMGALGFPREGRPFRPHLTLARFKEPRPQPALEKALAGFNESSLGVFEPAEYFLFESRLTPAGAEYRKVARFP
jgi:RNA 2',3'-cyclic 3'-phosphodiesterase